MLSEVDDRDNNAASTYKNTATFRVAEMSLIWKEWDLLTCARRRNEADGLCFTCCPVCACSRESARVTSGSFRAWPEQREQKFNARFIWYSTCYFWSGIFISSHDPLFSFPCCFECSHHIKRDTVFSKMFSDTLKTCECVHGFSIGLIRAAPAAHLGLFFHMVNAV